MIEGLEQRVLSAVSQSVSFYVAGLEAESGYGYRLCGLLLARSLTWGLDGSCAGAASTKRRRALVNSKLCMEIADFE
jgi:hypothetical protein